MRKMETSLSPLRSGMLTGCMTPLVESLRSERRPYEPQAERGGLRPHLGVGQQAVPEAMGALGGTAGGTGQGDDRPSGNGAQGTEAPESHEGVRQRNRSHETASRRNRDLPGSIGHIKGDARTPSETAEKGDDVRREILQGGPRRCVFGQTTHGGDAGRE